eukprot:353631-Chlamydomonas_euryale.AAC.5
MGTKLCGTGRERLCHGSKLCGTGCAGPPSDSPLQGWCPTRTSAFSRSSAAETPETRIWQSLHIPASDADAATAAVARPDDASSLSGTPGGRRQLAFLKAGLSKVTPGAVTPEGSRPVRAAPCFDTTAS